LQGQHNFRQILYGCGFTPTLLADLPVDAENAAQSAVSEKDGARSPLPHKGFFFSEMGVEARYHQLGGRLAESLLPLEAIGSTQPRAEFTTLHPLPQGVSSLFQFTTAVESQIGRLKTGP
jgi:hypothetical protein